MTDQLEAQAISDTVNCNNYIHTASYCSLYLLQAAHDSVLSSSTMQKPCLLASLADTC